MSIEETTTNETVEQENKVDSSVSNDAELPTAPPEALTGNEAVGQEVLPMVPNENFLPMVRNTFVAMSSDFNEFRNNSKTEEIKAAYLSAITKLNAVHAEIINVLEQDIQSRK